MIDVARLIVEIAGGGRVEHVAWPALAEQIETGDFVADISRIRARARMAPRRSACAMVSSARSRSYRGARRVVSASTGVVCSISRMRSWWAAPKRWC